MKRFRIIAIWLMAVAAIVIASELLVTRAKPREMTLTTMFVIHRRILLYAAEHGDHPKSLDDLPNLQGYDNRLVDAWNRRIDYRIIDGDIVELTSLGEDGLTGGTGEAQDIVRRFALHDKDGHWNDPLGDWLPVSQGMD
jgi:Type II secretion system (T2SS), protein G